MEINLEKSKVMRTTKQLSPLQTMTDTKHLKSVEYFNNLDSQITSDERCTVESNPEWPSKKRHSETIITQFLTEIWT